MGETTMSHLSQMLGIAVQSFLSAASSIALLFSLAFVTQGVIQNFAPNLSAQTLSATVYQQPRVDAQGQALYDAHWVALQDTLTCPRWPWGRWLSH